MVVDDATDIRQILGVILELNGYQPVGKANAAELIDSFDGPQPDIVLLDLALPDGNGLDLLPKIKQAWPETEVIVLTGHATLEAAVEATKRGAYNFQNKPFNQKTLMVSVERALEHKRLNEEASSLRKALAAMSAGASPVFQSASMKSVVRTIERIAPSDVSIMGDFCWISGCLGGCGMALVSEESQETTRFFD